ncbi:MAG: GTP-binding protein, partial [Clostridia bacterium]
GEICKKGIAVAIVVQANVGKSSLLNTLLGRERAIVTDIAGTTRDSVEENVEVDGVLLRLIDTAGIRETQDKVEAIGIERSLQAAKNSDIILFLTTANRKLNDEERQLLAEIEESGNQKILIVRNKCDLLAIDNEKDLIDKTSGDNILTNGCGAIVGQNEGGFDSVTISCKNKLGIDELRQKIVAMFHVELLDGNVDIITNERHKVAISKAIENIDHANATLAIAPTECLLVDLRTAYFALGEITGNTANEDIIDKIFSKFCLGK